MKPKEKPVRVWPVVVLIVACVAVLSLIGSANAPLALAIPLMLAIGLLVFIIANWRHE